MCATCGCNQPEEGVAILLPGEENVKEESAHPHEHHHDHHHDHGQARQVSLEQNVLQQNNLLAERNRGYLAARNVLALNLVSSPGSGKTTLLEVTLKKLKDQLPVAVIEGDQQTMQDAKRLEAIGVPVVQVNTGQGCHLDAHMVLHAIQKLNIAQNSMLFIENVGNLVCPAMFDLGESKRVVIISVTEGADKPLKYPYMFESSDVCIINKTDLLPYVYFDISQFKLFAQRINPELTFIELSATKGTGVDAWQDWLTTARASKQNV